MDESEDAENLPEEIDWKAIPEGTARQIMQQGEIYLQAQLQAALAADQRATTMASIFATLAAALVAGGIAYWDKSANLPVLLATLAAAATLLIAAAFGAWAARPIDFYFPGNQPSQWFPARKADLNVLLGGEAQNYDERIEYNGERLGENQRAIYRGFWCALASPVVAALVWAGPQLIPLLCRV